ncbi:MULTISPECIES: AfsR/SARP family transcriptional regulator [Streptomycetaceae]|uniref:AfsR/SARP family transcriptional regulator n=1 Tax=Streptomycetaceae TaxID=2062 RepID=UPI0018D28AAB|nr:BTAD domain-containing putative transcriptional regulator [Streptantibioticus cattleyicolor]
MRFGILGETWARSATGGAVGLGGPARRALLAMLLLDAGRIVPLERLIDGLYRDEPPAGVGNALQSQVSRLRSALGAPIENHPAGYRLVVEPDEVDVHRFTRLAARGREALAAGEFPRAAEALREGLALWRGAALADVGAAPFAAGQITRLEELRTTAVEDRVEADLALGRHRELVAELTELTATHPLRERLRAQLMRALHGAGRQADALRVYEEARRELADTLGADPGPELTAAHLAVLRGEPVGVSRETPGREADGGTPSRETVTVSRETAPAPAAVSGETPPPPYGRFPAQLTSFVGRAEELDRLAQLLGGARLVTLLGPGGSGKTRLSVEAAGRHVGDRAFVDLTGVADDGGVTQAVLAALGLRESALRSGAGAGARHEPLERLAAALAGRRLLLVLDNCEHVVASVATLVDRVLADCPGLSVLATSREALGITGEVLCPVPPLPLPTVQAAPRQAMDSPAVRLFAERAGAVRPDFDLARDLDAVRGICAALDGLPLAIELAAARLRSLSAAEIAERLGIPAIGGELGYRPGVRPAELFRLLSRGSRTAQPRQRTLRGVVDWSWGLLPEDERAVLRRASVFAGSWSLAAAEEVCADPSPDPARAPGDGPVIDPADVLDLVESLVDKSLVVADHQHDHRHDHRHPGTSVRYRMLETIRAYAAERLSEAGEEQAVRRAHARHFLRLAAETEPELRGHRQLAGLEALFTDHDNLHAALRRSIADGDTVTALRFFGVLSTYWILRGLRYEGAAPARDLLGKLGPQPPDGLGQEYVGLVLAAVFGMRDIGGYADHVAACRAVMEASGGITPDYPGLTLLWAPFAGLPTGPEMAERAAAPLRDHPDPWFRALLYVGSAYQRWWMEGDAAGAAEEFTEGLEAFRALGDRWGMITSLGVLAELAGFRGENARAVALSDEALALAAELGSVEDMAELVVNRSRFLLDTGRYEEARADARRTLELARRCGAPEFAARGHLALAEVARRTGDLAEADRLCELALAQCPARSFSGDGTRSAVLIAHGRVALALGDAERARRRLRQACALGSGPEIRMAATYAAEVLALLALLDGRPAEAAELLGAFTVLRASPEPLPPDMATLLAEVCAALGEERFAEAFGRGSARDLAGALGRVRELFTDDRAGSPD